MLEIIYPFMQRNILEHFIVENPKDTCYLFQMVLIDCLSRQCDKVHNRDLFKSNHAARGSPNRTKLAKTEEKENRSVEHNSETFVRITKLS